MSNPALYVSSQRKVYMENAPIQEPGLGELRIHVRANGVCGSDLSMWKKGKISSFNIDHPFVLGHESAGEVVEIGPGVVGFEKGDRVAIEPAIVCGECYACKDGVSNCCQNLRFSGAFEAGSIQRYKCHPARFCHRLPLGMTFSQGALLEPLSVVMNAFERLIIPFSSSILICGAGPIGIIAMLQARASGAARIVVTDINEDRLAFAKKLCPVVSIYRVDPGKSPQECGTEIKELFGDEKDALLLPRNAIECTGSENSIHAAIHSLAPRGVLMVVGMPKPEIIIPATRMLNQEIELKFSSIYSNSWPKAIAALSTGILNLDALVSHTFKLEQAVEAMETFADTQSRSIKVHIID